MKSYSQPGRREMLALFATSLLPGPFVSSPQMPNAPMTKVMVYPRGISSNPRSLKSPLAALVRTQLQPVLAFSGKDGLTARVRECLALAYSSNMSEQYLGVEYKVIWVIDHWVATCCGMTSFAIDFASRGTIVVDVEEVTILRW